MSLLIPYLRAFAVGGLICAASQLLIDYTRLTPARILTLLVLLGAALGALGLYQPFLDWAGAGAAVPLTGFGNALVKGVRRAVQEQGLLGAFTGGLSAASGGTAAAVFFALLVSLLFRPGDKNK